MVSPCTQEQPPQPFFLYPGMWDGSHASSLCPSRENVLRNLSDKAFDRPICEALLDQRFFNGIGNYLRAEILYRSAGRLWV